MMLTLSKFALIRFFALAKKTATLLPVLLLCLQSFSLLAQTSPSVTCPADIVQNNDPGACSARVTFPGSNDVINPAYTVIYNYNSGAPFPVGTTRVVKQLLDENGVVVASCTFNVTVLDTDPPVISNCPGNIAVNNTHDSCGAIVSFTQPTVYDRCTFQHKTFYYSGAPQTFIVPAGVTSIDVDVTGAAGGRTYYNNSVYGFPGLGGETSATIAVTPGQALIINAGGAGGNASAAAGGAGGYNGGGNGTAAADENGVIYAASGGGGGASDIRTGAGTLAERIIVAGGGGAAGFTGNGGDGGGETGANGANGTTPATGGTQTAGGTGGAYEEFHAGDGSLGTGGSGAPQTPGAGGGAGLYGGGGGAFGSGAGGSGYALPSATNVYLAQGVQQGDGYVSLTYNQPPTLVQTAGLPSGSTFPVGETINTFTATDASGNTASCTFKVTVTDNQQPIVTAPSNVSVSSDADRCAATNVALGTAVTSDNCGIATVTNNAPSSFPVGTTTVTYTATDVHGNTSTATQTVTVTDNQKPVVVAPSNVLVSANNNSCAATNVALGTPVTSDNCGVATVTNNAPSSFPVGTTTVTYTVTDIHGNTSVATQTVTVTDNQQPVLTVPAAQTFTSGAGSYTIPALVATDNCGVASITYAITGATIRTGTGGDASGTFNVGTSVITYTVTDVHGNVQSGTTTVTVTSAAQPPLVVTIPDAYAVYPGGKPNTIYIGYGPLYLFLNATVNGGKPPYTYVWTKNGFPISPFSTALVILPGDYTVTVTDSKGATGTAVKQIQVVDVRCGSNNDKVIVCKGKKDNKKSQTECVDQNKVESILQKGGYLGDCNSTASSSRIADKVSPEVIAEVTPSNFSVYPNPTTGQFTLRLSNFKPTRAEVLVLSQNGMAVQRKTVQLTGANQTIVFDIGNLANGAYLIKVVSDEGIQIAKVVLQH